MPPVPITVPESCDETQMLFSTPSRSFFGVMLCCAESRIANIEVWLANGCFALRSCS